MTLLGLNCKNKCVKFAKRFWLQIAQTALQL